MIYTEWGQLREVIVGRAYDPSSVEQFDDQEITDGMGRILEETEEDFQKLANLFVSEGVKVHRPTNVKLEPEQTRYWRSEYPYPAICPRDFHVVYGDKILSTIGGDCNRYTESDYFVEIMMEKFKEGRNYISMPKPLLDTYYDWYQNREDRILFHAANILKCGDTLVHTMPYVPDRPDGERIHGRGTYSGLDWLKRNIPDAKWAQMPASGHADGKIALIKPGVLMCWNRKHIPEELKNWAVIDVNRKELPEYFNKIKTQYFYKNTVTDWLNHWIGFVDETVFDINVISLNENTLITNGYDTEVAAQLKQHGVEMVPFDFRHKYFWDSGLHCVTLDLARDGEPESYV